MNKAKFNKFDQRQIGAMGLHILAINDMPSEKWLSYFTSDEMKQVALEDNNGFIGRLPPHLQELATDLLTVGAPESTIRLVDRGDALLTGGTKAPVSSVVKETVTTDKGVYTSVENLKVKLCGVYSIHDFDKVWVEALSLAKLDADVEYISNTSKKVLLSSVKSAILSAVEKTVDEF
jgi:hypothetical protein